MAWTTPLTAVSNATFTAAQYNASDRDNMLVTPAGLATTPGRFFVVTGANAIAERAITSATVATSETRTSTSYGDLTTVGPSVTVTTGTQALAFYSAQINNTVASSSSLVSIDVSGNTTIAAGDSICITQEPGAGNADVTASRIHMFTLNAGSNTFAMKYRVISDTGTFLRRELVVMGL